MADMIWDYLVNNLPNKTLRVEFTKVNGERRVMLCTTDQTQIPDCAFSDGPTKRERSVKSDVKVVWDLEKNDWRSIKKGRIISVEEVETDVA